LHEFIEDDNMKENKIDDEKKEEDKNIFNYYEYIYECIQIYIDDDTEISNKCSKFHLHSHSLNSDYLNKLINDGKNKKYLQKKKQKEAYKQRRLTMKKNS
ncbi:hypothetical protein HEP_00457800, partial [Hepatocystis sp. ex Piliocolobus tephrosceles]